MNENTLIPMMTAMMPQAIPSSEGTGASTAAASAESLAFQGILQTMVATMQDGKSPEASLVEPLRLLAPIANTNVVTESETDTVQMGKPVVREGKKGENENTVPFFAAAFVTAPVMFQQVNTVEQSAIPAQVSVMQIGDVQPETTGKSGLNSATVIPKASSIQAQPSIGEKTQGFSFPMQPAVATEAKAMIQTTNPSDSAPIAVQAGDPTVIRPEKVVQESLDILPAQAEPVRPATTANQTPVVPTMNGAKQPEASRASGPIVAESKEAATVSAPTSPVVSRTEVVRSEIAVAGLPIRTEQEAPPKTQNQVVTVGLQDPKQDPQQPTAVQAERKETVQTNTQLPVQAPTQMGTGDTKVVTNDVLLQTKETTPVQTRETAPVRTEEKTPVQTQDTAPVGTEKTVPVKPEEMTLVQRNTSEPVVQKPEMPNYVPLTENSVLATDAPMANPTAAPVDSRQGQPQAANPFGNTAPALGLQTQTETTINPTNSITVQNSQAVPIVMEIQQSVGMVTEIKSVAVPENKASKQEAVTPQNADVKPAPGDQPIRTVDTISPTITVEETPVLEHSSLTNGQETPIYITPVDLGQESAVAVSAPEKPSYQQNDDLKVREENVQPKLSVMRTTEQTQTVPETKVTSTAARVSQLPAASTVQSQPETASTKRSSETVVKFSPVDPATLTSRQQVKLQTSPATKENQSARIVRQAGLDNQIARQGVQSLQSPVAAKEPKALTLVSEVKVSTIVNQPIQLDAKVTEGKPVLLTGTESLQTNKVDSSMPKEETSAIESKGIRQTVTVSHSAKETTATPLAVPAAAPVQTSAVAETASKTISYEPKEVISQIAQGAHVMVRDGAVQMHLKLDPPELGRVELRIAIEQDGLKAHFVTESQTVKAIIETNLPHLRNALQQAGVNADNLSVSVGGRWTQGGNNGNGFAGRENHPFYQQNNYSSNNDTTDDIAYRENETTSNPWMGRINMKA